MEVSGQLHVPVALLLGKGTSYLFDRRLGGPKSQSGRGGEEKIIPAPDGNWILVVRPTAKSLQ
jgi:hypothetical protein